MNKTMQRRWLKYREIVRDIFAAACLCFVLVVAMWALNPISVALRGWFGFGN